MRLADRVSTWLRPTRRPTRPEDVFRSLWGRTARPDGTRHPFHRDVLTDLDGLISRVAATAPDTLVEVGGRPTRWDDLLQRHTDTSRCLTPDWMRNFVTTEVARVAAVADSTDYLVERSRTEFADGMQQTLTVQHRLSGLRAIFFWADGNSIGQALAMSSGIRSLDPDRRWRDEGAQAVSRWSGLGITSRIYQRAAQLEPRTRWRATALTPQSARMRRKLHRLDPWRYEAARNAEAYQADACLWCAERGWASLTTESFALHPEW